MLHIKCVNAFVVTTKYNFSITDRDFVIKVSCFIWERSPNPKTSKVVAVRYSMPLLMYT